MVAEYVAKITGDTSGLEKALKAANGSLKKLNEDEVLIKLNYDGNVKGFNAEFDKILKECPDLNIQFQYNVNQKMLDKELSKLNKLKDLKLDIDTNNVDNKIKSMIVSLDNSIANEEQNDIIERKIKNIYRYANTAKQLGATISVNLEDAIYSSVEGIEDLESVFENITVKHKPEKLRLFDIAGSIDDEISKTEGRVNDFQDFLSSLEKRGASKTGLSSELQQLQDEIKILRSDISDMQVELGNLSGEAFNQMTEDIKDMNDQLLITMNIVKELRNTQINPNNISFHVGNLGKNKNRWKSEGFHRMISNMTNGDFAEGDPGFGILGTGVYHTTDASQLVFDELNDNGKGYALNIDPKKYKLLKAATDEEAEKLLEFLGLMQGFVVAQGSGYQGWDERLKDIDIKRLFELYQSSFNETLLDIENFTTFIEDAINIVRDASAEGLSSTYEEVKIGDFISTKYNYADNIATRFLKKLGYEGVDLRNTLYDTYEQGSTIFDLHPEDIIETFDTQDAMRAFWKQNLKKINAKDFVNTKELKNAGEELGELVSDALADGIDAHSDSKRSIKSGEDFVNGLTHSIQDHTPEAVAAAKNLGEEVSKALTDSLSDSENNLKFFTEDTTTALENEVSVISQLKSVAKDAADAKEMLAEANRKLGDSANNTASNLNNEVNNINDLTKKSDVDLPKKTINKSDFPISKNGYTLLTDEHGNLLMVYRGVNETIGGHGSNGKSGTFTGTNIDVTAGYAGNEGKIFGGGAYAQNVLELDAEGGRWSNLDWLPSVKDKEYKYYKANFQVKTWDNDRVQKITSLFDYDNKRKAFKIFDEYYEDIEDAVNAITNVENITFEEISKRINIIDAMTGEIKDSPDDFKFSDEEIDLAKRDAIESINDLVIFSDKNFTKFFEKRVDSVYGNFASDKELEDMLKFGSISDIVVGIYKEYIKSIAPDVQQVLESTKWTSILKDPTEKYGKGITTDDISMKAFANGFDAVVIKNLHDPTTGSTDFPLTDVILKEGWQYVPQEILTYKEYLKKRAIELFELSDDDISQIKQTGKDILDLISEYDIKQGIRAFNENETYDLNKLKKKIHDQLQLDKNGKVDTSKDSKHIDSEFTRHVDTFLDEFSASNKSMKFALIQDLDAELKAHDLSELANDKIDELEKFLNVLDDLDSLEGIVTMPAIAEDRIKEILDKIKKYKGESYGVTSALNDAAEELLSREDLGWLEDDTDEWEDDFTPIDPDSPEYLLNEIQEFLRNFESNSYDLISALTLMENLKSAMVTGTDNISKMPEKILEDLYLKLDTIHGLSKIDDDILGDEDIQANARDILSLIAKFSNTSNVSKSTKTKLTPKSIIPKKADLSERSIEMPQFFNDYPAIVQQMISNIISEATSHDYYEIVDSDTFKILGEKLYDAVESCYYEINQTVAEDLLSYITEVIPAYFQEELSINDMDFNSEDFKDVSQKLQNTLYLPETYNMLPEKLQELLMSIVNAFNTIPVDDLDSSGTLEHMSTDLAATLEECKDKLSTEMLMDLQDYFIHQVSNFAASQHRDNDFYIFPYADFIEFTDKTSALINEIGNSTKNDDVLVEVRDNIDKINTSISDNIISKIQKLSDVIHEAFWDNNSDYYLIEDYVEDIFGKKSLDNFPNYIKQQLESINMVGSNGKAKGISGGFTNMGVLQNDDYTVIARPAHYENKLNSLIPQLNAAFDKGANVARILGIVVDKESDVLYDIQETVKGSTITENNLSFINASTEQLQKLVSDLFILQKEGLYIDIGGDNIAYDPNKGFSFFDLANKKKDFTSNDPYEIIQSLSGYVGDLDLAKQFKLNVDNMIDSYIADGRKIGQAAGESVIEGIREGVDAHSDSKESISVADDVVNGFIHQIDNRIDEIKNKGRELGEATIQGFKESIEDFKTEKQVVQGVVDSESNMFTSLTDALKLVIEQVEAKTHAFEEEGQIVDSVVRDELTNLDVLSGYLIHLKNDIEDVSNIFKGISLNIPDINGDTNEVTKFIKSLSGLKDERIDLKLINVFDKLDEFAKAINTIKIDDNSIISSINNLLNKSKELENLATILKSTKKEIEEITKNTSNKQNEPKNYKDTYYDKLNSTLSSAKSDIAYLEKKGKNTEEYVIKFKDTYKELLDLQDNEMDFVSEDDYKRLLKIIDVLNQIKKEASLSENKAVNEKSIQKYLGQINDILSKNTSLKFKKTEVYQELIDLKEAFESFDTSKPQNELDELGQKTLEVITRFKGLDESLKGGGFLRNFTHRLADMNAKFFAQYFSFQDMIRYAREAFNVIQELNIQMVELAKVSEQSLSQIEADFNSYANTAKELGATISDTISATADWARMGYNVPDAKQLAEVALLYKNVGDGIDITAANQSLISTLQGYQMQADEAEHIVDVFNEVANNYAIDTAGIGEALQRSAASLDAANTSLEQSVALVTAANTVVQNPESVGTTFKTLSARLRGAKTDLEELGEEEDEFTQTTSKLQSLIKGLTGFDILEADQKTFKSIYDILVGIGKEWKNLTDIEQASLGEALFGKRNANVGFAILNNIETLESAYETAENAAGSARREQENYEKGIEYSVNKAKAALQELAFDALDSDLLKGLIDMGTNAINLLDTIIDKFGLLKTAIVGIAGVIGSQKLG